MVDPVKVTAIHCSVKVGVSEIRIFRQNVCTAWRGSIKAHPHGAAAIDM